MKCISEEIFQKYIDRETTLKEEVFIKRHISGCAECSKKIEKYRESVNNIKKLINLLDENEIEVPGFKKPLAQKKNIHPAIKKFIYSAAAACILILFLIISHNQKKDIEIVYSYDLESEFNANLPISDQEMVIQIIDSEGKLFKY